MTYRGSFIPTIKVRIWLKETIYGGRSHAFTIGYRPHLVVKGKETYWGISVLSVANAEQSNFASPGREAELACELVYYAKGFEYEDLKRGATFEIREGPHVVGTGVVLSAFD